MIRILNKVYCCGCESCVQKCPTKCISFDEDNEGFCYPIVAKAKCINCGLCEKVCPVIHQSEPRSPISIHAAKNLNLQTRKISSSGGVFTLLAEQILQKGGVVFGAKFNSDWEVEHGYTESLEGLAAFRGSKYIQSRIGNSFKQVEHFLNEGREVLFSGVSCQTAGLRSFLGKDYNNLISVDILCHSVPSPKVWRRYLNEIISSNKIYDKSLISSISFKDKRMGWKNPSFTLTSKTGETISEIHRDNYFMRGFLNSLYNRPSCCICPARSLKNKSDITIADFWGIERILPKFEDNEGVSLIIISTTKGVNFYRKLNIDSQALDINMALNSQRSIKNSFKHHMNRVKFFEEFIYADNLRDLILNNLNYTPFFHRIKKIIKRIVNKLLNK